MKSRSLSRALVPLAVLVLLLTPAARALAQAPREVPASDAPGWPRVIVDGDDTLTVYQPQVDEWTDGELHARAAVAVQSAQVPQPVYGVAWLNARTSVDKTSRVVTLTDLEVARASFPTDPERTADFLDILRREAAAATTTMSLDRLQADLAIGRATGRLHRVPVRNDPPRLVYVTEPTVLVPIDGEPVLRRVAGTTLQRVINTRALIVYDLTDERYDLALHGRWLEAPDLTGPWTTVNDTPPALDRLASQLSEDGTVDLYDSAAGDDGEMPDVLVVTRPTELLQTDGPAELSPIPGTHLLYATNSDQDLFVDEATKTHYVRVSGRWYASPAWEGPWAYVEPTRLPQDFARIPTDSPKAGALTSVPGTPQAKEAVIANSIPQTATIDRRSTHYASDYDGRPHWVHIEGTDLDYADNSATPVIRLGPSDYYAVENGVWFTASSPDGPWEVADSVPADIYAIPPSCPIHYVTYVRVYGADANDVWVGYTPGYLGTCVGDDGTVVYGTGYTYTPWVGTVWYGDPWSYGWDACFDWTMSDGWWLSFGFGDVDRWRPWWGPSAWTWGDWDHDDRWVLNDCDLYHPPHWRDPGDHRPPRPWPGFVDKGPRGARPLPPIALSPGAGTQLAQAHRGAFRPAPASRPIDDSRPAISRALPRPGDTRVAPTGRPGLRPNDLYAGPDGRVYRPAPHGWETSTPHGWERVHAERSPLPGVQTRDWRPALDRDAEARRVGEMRVQHRVPAPPAPAVRRAPPPPPHDGRSSSSTPARGRGGPGRWR